MQGQRRKTLETNLSSITDTKEQVVRNRKVAAKLAGRKT